MTVLLLADRTATPRVLNVAVSPLAELGAALHLLTAIEHGASRWTAKTWAGMPASLRAECRLFSAIWGGYRSRYLLPTTPATDDFATELARVVTMPLDSFTTLTAYAIAGSDHRLAGELSPSRLRRRARGRGCAPAADLLIADAGRFRSRLVAVLEDCWTTFFAAGWRRRLNPQLSLAAVRTRNLLIREDPIQALCRLLPASRPARMPDRLVIDKLGDAVVDLARTDLLLVPSVLGAPHLLVKHEPGFPAVVQFLAGDPRPSAHVPQQLLTARLRVLSDPTRLQICRMIARHPRSTQELAETLRMSAPEMSRHLRVLRDSTMVSTEREGRFVLYTLRHDAVARLGADVLELLLR